MNAVVERRATSPHQCLIYDGHPSAQLPIVLPQLLDSLANNWRCLYVANPDMVHMVAAALGERGIDTRGEMARGALVLSSDRSHLHGGAFEPSAILDSRSHALDDAMHSGFEGLFTTGDVRWELGSDENFGQLVEYEAMLEQMFRGKPLRGVCQYHRGSIPRTAIHDALRTHRSAYIGEHLERENAFYVPPEILTESSPVARVAEQGDWMCQQLIRAAEAANTREATTKVLKDGVARQRYFADQLATLNADLERRMSERTAALRIANRDLEAFTHSIARDLRIPLNAVRAYSELLIDDYGETLDRDARGYVVRINESARRIETQIEGMMSLARALQVRVESSAVDLSAIADAVIRGLRETPSGRSAAFVVHSNMHAMGDAALLRTALEHMIGNAWKFTSMRPTPVIEVGQERSDGQYATFFVKDNGVGFDMTHAGNLFAPFERLHATDQFPGLGIGLAMTHRIVARHGGRMWADAAPGEGATFHFTLPAVPARA